MKTMGILGGMACESTVTYYNVINDYVNQALGDHHSARCILYSVEFQDIIDVHRTGNWARADEILSDAGLPLIHIADVTADRLLADGVKKVGLLGTKFTMEMDFYKQRLIDRGLEVLIPDEAARGEIYRIIDTELAFGDIREDSRAIYQAEIQKLKERGAQGVILGCTEIGLLIQQEHSVLPVYDTALIHAEESAKYALAD